MELCRRDFRAMIFYDFRQGLTQKQCCDRMKSTFGSEAPSKATIYNCFKEFSSSYNNLSDDVREGRPRSVLTPEDTDAVRKLIGSNRHVTYDEIETFLNISAPACIKFYMII